MKNFILILLCFFLCATHKLSAQLSIYSEAYGIGITFEGFGGSTNSITEDATVAHTGSKSLKIDVPAGGYTGGAMKSATPQDLSTYTAVSFWVKASAAKTLNVSGLGNNAATTVYQVELSNFAVTTTWTKVVIAMPNPAKLTAESGLFHFAEGADEGAYTLWIDDIQYETVAVGAATAAMATETITKSIGDSFSPNGATCSFNGVTLNITKAWFTYTSSNMGVATMNNTTGVGTVVGAGTTNITATMGATAVAGTLTVNVSAAAVGPTAAAATPTKAVADVVSLYSNAYTSTSANRAVDTWSAIWDQADVADVTIAGNDNKKYTNLSFAGIEFTTNVVDATTMTHFHMDVWTADAATFNVKLVDFGANGTYQGMPNDDSEHELSFTPTLSGWFAIDVPLSNFTGLTAREHLAQMIIVGVGGGKTVWVDNVYFYKTPPTEPTTAAPTPTRPQANVISMFSNAYTDLLGTNWNPNWSQSTVYTEVSVAGNATKKYANLNYQGAEPASPINATSATFLHVDFWAASATNFRIKLVDFGANGVFGLGPTVGDDSEHEIDLGSQPGGSWVAFDIPLADFTGLTARAHLAQFIISTTSSSPTIWLDNIYFYSNTAIPVELVNFKGKAVNNTTVLTWKTASERNNQGFTIERSSDGTSYSAIGQVKGNGTTSAPHDYTFTDQSPLSGLGGVNYYRLRQTDFDGKETVSPVVAVLFGKNGLVVKNTLAHDAVTVIVGDASPVAVSIFNMAGQQIYATKIQGTQQIDVSAWVSGLYVIRTSTGEVSRFVKQ